MSERDELADLICNNSLTNMHMASPIADAILAAGFRRIPNDCVVVGREDALVIADHWLIAVDEHFQPYDEDRDKAILTRLVAALTATRHGEDV